MALTPICVPEYISYVLPENTTQSHYNMVVGVQNINRVN